MNLEALTPCYLWASPSSLVALGIGMHEPWKKQCVCEHVHVCVHVHRKREKSERNYVYIYQYIHT